MSQDSSANNKRLAKNTLYLYVRMLITMVVSLYTSRVVLNALGAEDFGIYSIVGGIVVLLGFLNNAMAGATQRFLNFEMGRNSNEALNKVFTSSLAIHFLIAFVILVLAETIGLWFLNSRMNIAPARMDAANWVYQFSVLSFLAAIVSVPYNASIIAHEKMSAFAYIGVLEVFLKLLIAFAILHSPIDRLVYYAFLMLLVSILLRIVYGVYCGRHFRECHFVKSNIDSPLIRKMLSFASWTIFGNLGYILHTQGIAIIINLFFGALVNAAQGISNQVNTVVRNFVNNFLTALNPQIVKTYSASDLPSMHMLISRGCRIAFCMVLLLTLPLILEMPLILKVWLKNVPEYTVIFVRLVLLITLCDSFSSVLATAKGATGDIKKYQITLTTIGFFHLPLAWLFFFLGYEPYYAMYVYVFIINILQITRIWFVCRAVEYPLADFYKGVVGRCLSVTFLSSIIPIYLHRLIGGNAFGSAGVIACSLVMVSMASLYIGLNRKERAKVISLAQKKINSVL